MNKKYQKPRVYSFKPQSASNVRREELNKVPVSIKKFVDMLGQQHSSLQGIKPQTYLYMDDCTFCT